MCVIKDRVPQQQGHATYACCWRGTQKASPPVAVLFAWEVSQFTKPGRALRQTLKHSTLLSNPRRPNPCTHLHLHICFTILHLIYPGYSISLHLPKSSCTPDFLSLSSLYLLSLFWRKYRAVGTEFVDAIDQTAQTTKPHELKQAARLRAADADDATTTTPLDLVPQSQCHDHP